MGKNFLIEALRETGGKKNLFENNASVISYKTGFPVLDYYLGYRVNVFDEKTWYHVANIKKEGGAPHVLRNAFHRCPGRRHVSQSIMLA